MKRCRILFIWTDIESRIETGVIHLGVAYLSATLKRAGHETALIRVLEKIEKNELLRRVADFRPDLIAFSAMTNQFDYCAQLADWIKEPFDIPILFGGHHPSLAPEEVIATRSVDMLCRGEGEEALVELADRLADGRDYSETRNLWVKKNGAVVRNEVHPIRANINDMPFMDLDIFNLNEMFPPGAGINLHFMSGRGCPYNCSYCCNPAIRRLYRGKGRIVRFRDVPVAVAELKHHRRNYPRINYFTGQDETFTLRKDWAMEFCRQYRREVGVPFSAMVRLNQLDEEMMRALKSANCDLLRIGVESGSEWLREHVLRRKMSNEQIVRVFDLADKIGIRTWAFIIIGFPHETPAMVEETFSLVRRIRPNQTQLAIYYPYPGTDLYEEAKREGWLTGETASSYFEKPVLNLPTIGREQILDYYEAFRQELVEMAARKEGRGVYDFISNIDSAATRTDDGRFIKITTFFEEYPARFWLQAHPFSEITYNVDLPPNGKLVFDIGMDPTTYKQPGKGVKFEIEQNGKKIFSEYLDPKSREKDRGWFHHEVPLRGEGKTRITFRTMPAPRSSNYYCNAGWGRPHVAV